MVGRRAFLCSAGAAAGAVLLGGCGSDGGRGGDASNVDRGTEVQGDIEVLAFALDVEHRSIATYDAAREVLRGEAARLASEIAGQEREHARRLSEAYSELGGRDRGFTATVPKLSGPAAALEAVRHAEDDAIAAYIDALPKISDSSLRSVVAGIAASEAAHLAVVAGLLELPQAPDSFVYGEKRS